MDATTWPNSCPNRKLDTLDFRMLIQGTRKLAGQLRSETLGLLYQFRASVRSEIAYKKLSSDLEGHIFGYLDELSSRRPGRNSKTPAPTPTAAPAATGG